MTDALISSRLEARAYRAARRVGLAARKSRSAHDSGGFMLIDPDRNWVVGGERYNWSAQDVLDSCAEAMAAAHD